MKFYRFLLTILSIPLMFGCIGEDYKLWGSGSSGNYSYNDMKNENTNKTLLTVIYSNPARLDQASAEKFVIAGLINRYAEDIDKRKVAFTTNPSEATASATKLVIQFDLAQNILPEKLCASSAPLNFLDVKPDDPIYLAVVYCKYDEAKAWIRGESLPSSKVQGELIALIVENALQRMTSIGFGEENDRKN